VCGALLHIPSIILPFVGNVVHEGRIERDATGDGDDTEG
jgi:hypothetical protein